MPSRPARSTLPGTAACASSMATAPWMRTRSSASCAATGHGLNAHLVRQRDRRLHPVQPGLGLVDLVRVGHPASGWGAAAGRWSRAAGPAHRPAPARRVRTGGRAAGRRFVGTDFERLREQQTGVQAFSICIRQTPVSLSPASIARWIGAAPRQRGNSEGVHVPAAVQRMSSTDCGGSGRRRPPPSGRVQRTQGPSTAPEVLRLQHRDAALHRFQLDRRRVSLRPPAGRSRLGVDGHHLGLVRGRAQAGHGEFGVPAKTMRIGQGGVLARLGQL